jgi:hypothetical protein
MQPKRGHISDTEGRTTAGIPDDLADQYEGPGTIRDEIPTQGDTIRDELGTTQGGGTVRDNLPTQNGTVIDDFSGGFTQEQASQYANSQFESLRSRPSTQIPRVEEETFRPSMENGGPFTVDRSRPWNQSGWNRRRDHESEHIIRGLEPTPSAGAPLSGANEPRTELVQESKKRQREEGEEDARKIARFNPELKRKREEEEIGTQESKMPRNYQTEEFMPPRRATDVNGGPLFEDTRMQPSQDQVYWDGPDPIRHIREELLMEQFESQPSMNVFPTPNFV